MLIANCYLLKGFVLGNYLKTVTLGAFTWKNQERLGLFFAHIKKTGAGWLVLHFLLLTLCVNFPVMYSMARLPPHELFTRLNGGETSQSLPESVREALAENALDGQESVEDFNLMMIENGYGARILMPLMGMAFGLVLIIQAVFYGCVVVFLGISRLHAAPLSVRGSLGLALYSSTLPAPAAALFGLFLPAVHIIVFYFLVMFFVFQRSRLCPNG